jgi:hypothetical protein
MDSDIAVLLDTLDSQVRRTEQLIEQFQPALSQPEKNEPTRPRDPLHT